jgi:CPA1 family monovalent cation:H+ antiporter
MLPTVVRWLGLSQVGSDEHLAEINAELDARRAALEEVGNRLDRLVAERKQPPEEDELLRNRHLSRKQILRGVLEEALAQMRLSAEVKKELIDAERSYVYQRLRDGKITDEARRRIEYELDLEEASLANRAQDGGGWM